MIENDTLSILDVRHLLMCRATLTMSVDGGNRTLALGCAGS